MAPAHHKICSEVFAQPWGACDIEVVGSTTIGAHAHAPGNALASTAPSVWVADGEASLYARMVQSPSSLWRRDGSGLHLSSSCRGNIALWNAAASQLTIGTEWTGSFPLYYAARPGEGFLFASRMSVIASALQPTCDAMGVVEFLRDASFQSDRSYWTGIRRLQPGQALIYDVATDRVTVSERSQLWASTSNDDQRAWLEEVWDKLGRSVERDRAVSIMMSGGWDSRTLLARSVASSPPAKLMAYSHGDPRSREIRLAQQLSGAAGIAFHQEPIDGRCYDLSALQTGFDREEHLVFPHWHRAGRLAAAMGPRVVTAGVYGEVLGGHYGRAMLLQGSAKIREVLSGLVGARHASPPASSRDLAALSEFLHVRTLTRPWPVHRDWWEAAGITADELNRDIDRDLARLQTRGVRTVDQLIEAYVSEHRGSQYINAQIRSCRAHTDVSLPFAERTLLECACAFPLGVKIHNRLNQEMLRRFAPTLLRYPMAATLADARRPLIVQEASRLIRKGLELGRWRLHFASRGRVQSPRLSWVNFEFLRDGHELRAIVEDLRADLWDKSAILSRAEQLADGISGSAHPMSDQVMKIYTVDLALRAATGAHSRPMHAAAHATR